MYKLTARNANVFGSTFALLANTPSQAHLQGTQSRRTKANLAKEPALCQRFWDTSCFVGHILSIQINQDEGRTYNIGFSTMLADVVTMSCI